MVRVKQVVEILCIVRASRFFLRKPLTLHSTRWLFFSPGWCYFSSCCIVAGFWRGCGLVRLQENEPLALSLCPTASTAEEEEGERGGVG